MLSGTNVHVCIAEFDM